MRIVFGGLALASVACIAGIVHEVGKAQAEYARTYGRCEALGGVYASVQVGQTPTGGAVYASFCFSRDTIRLTPRSGRSR